jgi:hypothetical protein
MVGLVISSLLVMSTQSAEEITGLRVSLQFINPIDVIAHQDNVLDSLTNDSVSINIHFSVTDTIDLEGVTCHVLEDSESLLNEEYFAFEDYENNYESDLYRDGNYFITPLGEYIYSDEVLVKVKLHYVDRETSFYSKSVNN